MEKRLYRNEHNKYVAGVASGLADYMGVDIAIIRLLFILTTIFAAGLGIIAYIVLWIVLPVNNDPTLKYKQFNDYFKDKQPNSMFNSSEAFSSSYQAEEQTKWNTPNFEQQPNLNQFKKSNDTSRTVVGLILLALGLYFLLRELGLVPYWFSIFKIYKLWPLAIVVLGVSLIFRSKGKADWENFKRETETAQQKKDEPAKANDPTIEDVQIIEEQKKDEQSDNAQ